MREPLTIGILGGMGPAATNRLCALITAATPAHTDQEHIPVITYNNPAIPSRVQAIAGTGASPVPELIRTARVLANAGADLLLLPCNLAHYYLSELQAGVHIPVLDMINETVAYVAAQHPACRKAGLLASTPTLDCHLYDAAFGSHGIAVAAPPAVPQARLVMQAIYGAGGIKAGHKTRPRALLVEAAQELVTGGAAVVIAGCTEVSLVLTQRSLTVPVIDPLAVLATVAVRLAGVADSPGR